MTESEFAGVRLTGFVLAVMIAIALERVAPHGRLRGDWRTNLGLWSTGVVMTSLLCGTCAFTVANWAHSTGIGLLPVLRAPWWITGAVCVLALDLVSYGWHRANHQLPLLWRFHQVHHSDTAFTVSTGLRFHPGELLLALPVRLAAIVMLGAPVQGVIVFEVLFTLANLVEHGDIDLPRKAERRLERLFIVPATHRWHHSRQWPELNTNFGTIFVLWDRVFGTYQGNASITKVETGLPGTTHPPSLLQAITLPLTKSAGWTRRAAR